MADHPNFPIGLDIRPLIPDGEPDDSVFESERQENAIQKYGIAGRVWEAAHIMVQYLRQPSSTADFDPSCTIFSNSFLRTPRTVLELGSGNGYVGINLTRQLLESGRNGDLLILTDLPDVCPLLEENVTSELKKVGTSHETRSKAPETQVKPLTWGVTIHANELLSFLRNHSRELTRSTYEEAPILTHIICSDLVYFPDLLAPLLRSLLQLTAPPFVSRERPPEVLISYKVRSLAKETPFWSAFGLWFSFRPVSVRRRTNIACSPDSESGETVSQWGNWRTYGIEGETSFLFSAFRLPESYGWTVPQNDKELLSGVGARGTSTPKSDDTFELILLVGMDLDEQ